MTAVANGTTNIIATCGSKSASCSVTVSLEEVSVPCTSIQLSSDTLTFTESGSQTLTYTVTPENTTDAVTWTSDNESVATVSNGIVTAVGNGSCVITVSCGSYSDTCSVEVSGIVESDWTVEWNGETDSLPVGMTANENCTFVLNEETGKYEISTTANNTEANITIDDSLGLGVIEIEIESSNWRSGTGWNNGLVLRKCEGYRQVVFTTGAGGGSNLYINSLVSSNILDTLSTDTPYKIRMDNTNYTSENGKGIDVYINDELVLSNSIKVASDTTNNISYFWTTSSNTRLKAIRYKKVVE